tara:strand:+ start:416 stop:1003 length:588 start_codon:yes stop_codon:yes gene_type:complete
MKIKLNHICNTLLYAPSYTKQQPNMSNESIDTILNNIRDNASTHYNDDYFNQHYKVHNDFQICDKKQNILIEYYKKREQWTDVSNDNLEPEYNACINMLRYIHLTMFGGNDQPLYDNVCKTLINSKSVSIDDDYELRDDILDCVTYYKEGFQNDDDDDEDDYTTTERELQIKIIDFMVKILNNPNFQEVYPDERV